MPDPEKREMKAMFHAEERFVPFEKKVWLSSPTMHGPELEYIKDAYEKNWMSTVGENINEVERLACETVGCKYAVALATGTSALHLAVKLAGVKPCLLYTSGSPLQYPPQDTVKYCRIPPGYGWKHGVRVVHPLFRRCRRE